MINYNRGPDPNSELTKKQQLAYIRSAAVRAYLGGPLTAIEVLATEGLPTHQVRDFAFIGTQHFDYAAQEDGGQTVLELMDATPFVSDGTIQTALFPGRGLSNAASLSITVQQYEG